MNSNSHQLYPNPNATSHMRWHGLTYVKLFIDTGFSPLALDPVESASGTSPCEHSWQHRAKEVADPHQVLGAQGRALVCLQCG